MQSQTEIQQTHLFASILHHNYLLLHANCHHKIVQANSVQFNNSLFPTLCKKLFDIFKKLIIILLEGK